MEAAPDAMLLECGIPEAGCVAPRALSRLTM
jgi:hypothetical protein